MTDLNKPVKIKHDAETGDILNIENRQLSLDEIADVMSLRSQQNYANDVMTIRRREEEKVPSTEDLIEAGDILSIENDCAVDDYCLHSSAEEILSEVEKTEAEWDAEDAHREYMERTNNDLRFMAIREEEAAKAERSRQWREEATVDPKIQAANAYHEKQAELYEMALAAGELKFSGVPKPNQVHFKPSPEKIKEMAEAFKPMQENFKKIGKSAKKATESFKKFPATGSHENRGTNLQHRPFHNLEMIVFRDSLEENQ